MATSELFEHPLAGEIMAYQRMQDDLERDFHGRWVIIHGEKMAGEGYESYEEAESAASIHGPGCSGLLHQTGWSGHGHLPVLRKVVDGCRGRIHDVPKAAAYRRASH